MEQSILKSTKRILGISPDDTVFDIDIITHINAALSTLNELGVGPEEGIAIEDEQATWDDLNLTTGQLGKVKTYVYLRVRMLFDPPATSFHLEAMNKQILELEWRLNVSREVARSEEVIA